VAIRVDEASLYEAIGAEIRKRRTELGMIQTQVADAAGVLRTSIANIEAGRQKAPLHVLYRMCAALGLDMPAILPAVTAVAHPDPVVAEAPEAFEHALPKAASLLRRLLDEAARGV
jgi:transcriptional regulator with XRE-family HTH domain